MNVEDYLNNDEKVLLKFDIKVDYAYYLSDGELSYNIKTSPYNKISKDKHNVIVKDLLINPVDYANIYGKYENNITNFKKIPYENIQIYYTDGSKMPSSNNAGWAYAKLLEISKHGLYDDLTGENYLYNEVYGNTEGTTNNSGELFAIYSALEDFANDYLNKCPVIISDSEYSLNIYREWIYNWKNNGYKDSHKKPIKNKDIILKTDKLINDNRMKPLFCWVKGHEDHPFNEICDQNAKAGQFLTERKEVHHYFE